MWHTTNIIPYLLFKLPNETKLIMSKQINWGRNPTKRSSKEVIIYSYLFLIIALNISVFINSLQVVFICWNMMKSTPSHCPVHMHAPSSQFPGWNWAAKSTLVAPSRATQLLSLFRLNPFMVANYTSEYLMLFSVALV